jgi:hypothetical protein
LDIIGLLRGFKAFGEAAGVLGRSSQRGETQQNCERHRAVARKTERRAASGEPGHERPDDRRPCR